MFSLKANAKAKTIAASAPAPDSKMSSAQNARLHALSAADLYVPEDRQREFDIMKSGYEAEINPVGHVQQELFDQLLHAAWNLRAARRLFSQALAEGDDARCDRWQRYINQHERAYHRSLKMLRTLQTDRAVKCLPEHQHLETLPDTVEPGKLLREMLASARRTHRPPVFQPSPQVAPAPPPPRKHGKGETVQ